MLDALKKYQNGDGGFGHALEPDLRTDESSALCTSIAFQVLRSIQAKPDDVLVSKGIAYLLQTLDREKGCWRIIPRATEQSPHAPWWNQGGRENVFDGFSLNPSAEILGYLYDYQDQIPDGILALVSEQVVNHLSGLEKIEMHELLCCLRLFQTKNLPRKIHEQICQKLSRLIDESMTCDPLTWKGYGLRPLQIVDDPESPFMPGREKHVAVNLDYEISSQNKDGSWTPTWTWGDAFPEAWEIAYCEWTGILTLEKLLLLKRFKRIIS